MFFKKDIKTSTSKILYIALFCYIIALAITLLIPASDGYNEFTWKLFVGQIFAIPVFLIVLILLLLRNKKITA